MLHWTREAPRPLPVLYSGETIDARLEAMVRIERREAPIVVADRLRRFAPEFAQRLLDAWDTPRFGEVVARLGPLLPSDAIPAAFIDALVAVATLHELATGRICPGLLRRFAEPLAA